MAINHHLTQPEKPLPKKPFDADPQYVYLTPRQMEERFGLSRSYWYRKRDSLIGPLFVPLGARKILYRLDIVQAWFEAQFVQGFDDPKYKALKEKHGVSKGNNRKHVKPAQKNGTGTVIRCEISVVRSRVGLTEKLRPKVFRFMAETGAPRRTATASEAARSRISFPRVG